jgi:hypothetical protein
VSSAVAGVDILQFCLRWKTLCESGARVKRCCSAVLPRRFEFAFLATGTVLAAILYIPDFGLIYWPASLIFDKLLLRGYFFHVHIVTFPL